MANTAYGFEATGQWVKDPTTGRMVYQPSGYSALQQAAPSAAQTSGAWSGPWTGPNAMPTAADLQRFYQGDISNSPEYANYFSMYGDPPDEASWWTDPSGAMTQNAGNWFLGAQQGGDAERQRQAEADDDSLLGDLGPLLGIGGLALGGLGLAGIGPLSGLGSALGTAGGAAGAAGGIGMGIPELGMIADAGTAATAMSGGIPASMLAAGAGAGAGGFLSGLGITGNGLLNFAGQGLGAALGYNASQNASEAQAAAAQQALALQKQMYEQNRADLGPWRAAGQGALGNLVGMSTPGMQFDQMQLDPGYQFRLGEGEKGINRAAAGRGSFDSGATLKALQRYGQDYASNEFGNVWNRNAGLAGVGQTATNNTAQLGANYAGQAGDLTTQAGNARASGYMGGANAISGGIGGLLNTYNQYQMLPMLSNLYRRG